MVSNYLGWVLEMTPQTLKNSNSLKFVIELKHLNKFNLNHVRIFKQYQNFFFVMRLQHTVFLRFIKV